MLVLDVCQSWQPSSMAGFQQSELPLATTTEARLLSSLCLVHSWNRMSDIAIGPKMITHTFFEESQMGVDAKWGRFPICPEMSRFVPVCPLLSRFVPVPGPKKHKRGQTGTKRDISGQIGKRPHLASTPIWLSSNFYCLRINYPITQDICYTRLAGRNYFV